METDLRFWIIELIAYWEGEVSTRHLSEYLHLSRQQASKYFGDYRKQNPQNLTYCSSRKRFTPTEGFTPTCISGSVNEYLEWMTGRQAIPKSPDPALSLPHVALSPPPRLVSHKVMRGLVKAIRQQRRLDIDYLSVSNPDDEGRVIVPHNFIFTGLRWHLRAYCEKNGEYRDFVLSRFRGEPELLDRSPQGAEQDKAWNTFVQLILRPDPRLDQDKQEALEQDYGMENGKLTITVRAPLVQYQLQEMQVNVKMLDGTPEAQQLVLVNVDEVRPWLFNG